MFIGVLAFAMFLGSFAAGTLPLWIPASERNMRLTSVLGAGLIISTALVVIIPEGIETLLESVTSPSNVKVISATKYTSGSPPAQPAQSTKSLEIAESPAVVPADAVVTGPNVDHLDDVAEKRLHSIVGPMILLGFCIMLIVEQFQGSVMEIPHVHSSLPRSGNGGTPIVQFFDEYRDISVESHRFPSDSSFNIYDADAGSSSRPGGDGNVHRSLNATIGMIFHSISDGVALGAATVADESNLQFIVFLAILLHKAPSAFGLVSYLLQRGNWSRRLIKLHLMAFSAAAPIAAILTSVALASGKQEGGKSQEDIRYWTGILLLFSAGSFLYVAAVHILPEVLVHRSHLSLSQLGAMILGMIIPVILQLNHSH
jgi:zinc transporter 9